MLAPQNKTDFQVSGWEEEQTIRLHNMRGACKKDEPYRFSLRSWLRTHRNDLRHILVSDKYRTLYCYVPKAACTNWKRTFLYLNNVAKNSTEAKLKTHKMENYKTLAKIPEDEALFILQSYSKFIFVRNPISRALSAYREKFATFKKRGRSQWVIDLANTIYDHFGNHTVSNVEDSPPHNGHNISFQEFVRYLGDHQSQIDVMGSEHWKPMSDICYPCEIQYDAIGKFETFEVDSMHLLRRLKREDLLDVVLQKSDHHTGSSTDEVLREYYSVLTPSEKEGLNWRYRTDIELFDYNLFY